MSCCGDSSINKWSSIWNTIFRTKINDGFALFFLVTKCERKLLLLWYGGCGLVMLGIIWVVVMSYEKMKLCWLCGWCSKIFSKLDDMVDEALNCSEISQGGNCQYVLKLASTTRFASNFFVWCLGVSLNLEWIYCVIY